MLKVEKPFPFSSEGNIARGKERQHFSSHLGVASSRHTLSKKSSLFLALPFGDGGGSVQDFFITGNQGNDEKVTTNGAVISRELATSGLLEDLEDPDARKGALKKIKRLHWKNIVLLSVGFLFTFIAFSGLRNIQNSLVHQGGWGNIAMAGLHFGEMGAGIFSGIIISKLQPKKCLVIASAAMAMLTVSNFYPRPEILVVGTLITGLGNGILWPAEGTYIIGLGESLARHTGKDLSGILSTMNGFFFLIWELAQLIGSLISALVLNYGPRGESPDPKVIVNVTTEILNSSATYSSGDNGGSGTLTMGGRCGALYDPAYVLPTTNSLLDDKMRYTLLSIYIVSGAISISIFAFALQPFKNVFESSQRRSFKRTAHAVCGLIRNPRMIMLSFVGFYIGLRQALLFGGYTKAFVTCPLGIGMVGYTMMAACLASGVASLAFGFIAKVLPIEIILTGALISDVGLMGVMYKLHVTETSLTSVMLLGVWLGVGDGTILSLNTSLLGTQFPEAKEAVMAWRGILWGGGMGLFFACSFFLSMAYRMLVVCLGLALTLCATICFVITTRTCLKNRN